MSKIYLMLQKSTSCCRKFLLFGSLTSSSYLPSGPPVIVGMSINIASIDSISEVNMVSVTFSLLQ